MNWLLVLIGALVMLLGGSIWRFKLTYLLSNVDSTRIINKEKAARLAGSYIITPGAFFVLFGCFYQELTEKEIVLVMACFIPVNMVIVVSYMVAQSRNMK